MTTTYLTNSFVEIDKSTHEMKTNMILFMRQKANQIIMNLHCKPRFITK